MHLKRNGNGFSKKSLELLRVRTEEREVRMGAEATEVEASGRKNAWEGREIVTWCPGQAGQAGADGLAMMLSRSPCRGEAGRGGGVGTPEAEVCGEGGSAGHLREVSEHEDRKDARHSGSQMPFARIRSVPRMGRSQMSEREVRTWGRWSQKEQESPLKTFGEGKGSRRETGQRAGRGEVIFIGVNLSP